MLKPLSRHRSTLEKLNKIKEGRGFQFFYVIETADAEASGTGPIDPPNPDLGFIDFEFVTLGGPGQPQLQATTGQLNTTTTLIERTTTQRLSFVTTGDALETVLGRQEPTDNSSGCLIEQTSVPIGALIR